jgi:hypothetical protein
MRRERDMLDLTDHTGDTLDTLQEADGFDDQMLVSRGTRQDNSAVMHVCLDAVL